MAELGDFQSQKNLFLSPLISRVFLLLFSDGKSQFTCSGKTQEEPAWLGFPFPVFPRHPDPRVTEFQTGWSGKGP